jgi:hypothetical protein
MRLWPVATRPARLLPGAARISVLCSTNPQISVWLVTVLLRHGDVYYLFTGPSCGLSFSGGYRFQLSGPVHTVAEALRSLMPEALNYTTLYPPFWLGYFFVPTDDFLYALTDLPDLRQVSWERNVEHSAPNLPALFFQRAAFVSGRVFARGRFVNARFSRDRGAQISLPYNVPYEVLPAGASVFIPTEAP